MAIADEMRLSQQADREAAWKVYVPLARKDATEGRLSPAEKKSVLAAIAVMGFSAERTEADAHVFQREQQLAAAAAPLAEACQRRDEVSAANAKADAEAQAVRDKLDRELQERRAAMAEANKRVSDAERAAADLADLRGAHWKLLGCADPAIAGRQRHLVQAIFMTAVPAGLEHEVLTIEQIMQHPPHAAVLTDPANVPCLPGQSAEQRDALLRMAMQIGRAGKRNYYLLPAADAERVKRDRDLVLYADGAGQGRTDLYHWPTSKAEAGDWIVNFVPAPGQTPDELSGLMTRLRMRLGRERKERGDRDLVGDSGVPVERVGGVGLGR